jgi:hypothetical protein
MTHVVLLNLVFFIPATCGASAFALLIYRFVVRGASDEPPAPEGPGGAKVGGPPAGPDDLARSA